MKKINIIKTFFIFVLLTNCGFERMNITNKNNFSIKEVKLNGNKKIGYNIKNTMMVYSNPGSENRININLKVDKKKVSKEKNISNTITKFTLNLNVDLEIQEVNEINKKTKNFNSSIDFDVGQNHSSTVIKENKSIESATQIVVEEIIRYLQIKYK